MYRVGKKNAPTLLTPISHKVFKLLQWKSNQIKGRSILFRMMYGFLAICAIEMAKMATWKNRPKKFKPLVKWLLLVNGWSYQSVQITKQKLIQFPFEWCMVSWPSDP